MKKISLDEKEVDELVKFYEGELKKAKKRTKDIEALLSKLKGSKRYTSPLKPLPEREVIIEDDEEVVVINPSSHNK